MSSIDAGGETDSKRPASVPAGVGGAHPSTLKR